MAGLILSQLILFLAVELAGFALGWRLFAWAHAGRRRQSEREIETLRTALAEAQVRRARMA